MSKRLFIDADFAEAERRAFASALLYRPMPDLVLVCTDTLGDDVLRTETEKLTEVFKNATAIETEGHEQVD
jgi:hypothetical protein